MADLRPSSMQPSPPPGERGSGGTAGSAAAAGSGGTAGSGELLWLTAELLASPHLEIDTALVAVASACRGCDAGAVLARLDVAALGLFECERSDPQAQAKRVATVLTDTLGLLADDSHPDSLLIDRALARRRAHPVLIAAIGREVARRAGLHSQVCKTREGWWTALCADGRVALVGNHPDGPPRDPRSLQTICPHQLAFALLRCLARGDCSCASAAEHLLRALPECARS